jgi:hypothetical protein
MQKEEPRLHGHGGNTSAKEMRVFRTRCWLFEAKSVSANTSFKSYQSSQTPRTLLLRGDEPPVLACTVARGHLVPVDLANEERSWNLVRLY